MSSVGEAVGRAFRPAGADVNVLLRHVAEVLLAEAPFRLCVRGHRLGQRDRDAGFLAGQDLFAVEVAAVGDDIEFSTSSVAFVSLATVRELRSVGPDVGHLMRDDQMMLGVDGDLDVVAHDAGAAAAGRHRAASGSVSDICWSGVASICTLRAWSRCICSFSFSIFSFRRLVLVLSASTAPAGRRCRAAADSARRSPRSAPCAAPSWRA